jgi:hypothetical protein
MKLVEISAQNILSAKVATTRVYEQNRLENKHKIHKTFGSKTFYVEKSELKESGIFIPDLVRAYKNITSRNELFLLFEETAEKLIFVFADSPTILTPESSLKIEINKDKYLESSLKKIEELVRFYSNGERVVDVLCEPKHKARLIATSPFDVLEKQKRLNFLQRDAAVKIAKTVPSVFNSSFRTKQAIIVLTSILIPMFVLGYTVESIADNKRASLEKDYDNLNLEKQKSLKALEQLKKDEFYTNDKYYQSLKNKKVLK